MGEIFPETDPGDDADYAIDPDAAGGGTTWMPSVPDPAAAPDPEPAAAAAPDPDPADRISPADDAALPDLEALIREAQAYNVTGEMTQVITALAGIDGLWLAQWQQSGFTIEQAFELVRIMVRERFRS